MNRQTVKRFMVKGAMAYVAVFSLVLIVAMPALAILAVNSVDSAAIINGQVKKRDIRKRAVIGKKIAKRAVGSYHVKSIKDKKIRYSKKTGYLSIPTSALRPIDKDYDYIFDSGNLYMNASDGTFQAAVYLPQGAKVTKFQYYCKDFDGDADATYARLQRIDNLQTSLQGMADTGNSPELNAWRVLTDTSIDYATINNKTHAYFVEVFIGDANVALRAGNIIITYTYTSPGS